MTLRVKNLALSFVIVIVAIVTQAPALAEGQRYRDEVFDSVVITSDIVYGQAVDENGAFESLRLDLYEPADDTETARPAFIWIHGGSFSAGNKSDPLEALIGDEFARRGYVVASINYRLREGVPYAFDGNDPNLPGAVADAQHDAQAAVRWLRANAAEYGVDGGRIAVGGFSAGAVTALYVNFNSSDPGDSGNPGYSSSTAACVDISGGVDVALMDAGEPPVLVVHGTQDRRVPYGRALDIVARAQDIGVEVEFHPAEGGHVLWDMGYTEQIIDWTSDFLFRRLAPPPIDGDAASPTPAARQSDDGDSKAWSVVVVGVGVTFLLIVGVLLASRRLRGR